MLLIYRPCRLLTDSAEHPSRGAVPLQPPSASPVARRSAPKVHGTRPALGAIVAHHQPPLKVPRTVVPQLVRPEPATCLAFAASNVAVAGMVTYSGSSWRCHNAVCRLLLSEVGSTPFNGLVPAQMIFAEFSGNRSTRRVRKTSPQQRKPSALIIANNSSLKPSRFWNLI